MQIFIKTIVGNVLTLEVDSTDTIDKIKLELEKQTTVPVKDQRLIHNGKQADKGSLADNSIGKNAYIHLVGRLRAV